MHHNYGAARNNAEVVRFYGAVQYLAIQTVCQQ